MTSKVSFPIVVSRARVTVDAKSRACIMANSLAAGTLRVILFDSKLDLSLKFGQSKTFISVTTNPNSDVNSVLHATQVSARTAIREGHHSSSTKSYSQR